MIDEVPDEDIDESVKASDVMSDKSKTSNPLLRSKGSLNQDSFNRLLSVDGSQRIGKSTFSGQKMNGKPLYQTTVYNSQNVPKNLYSLNDEGG